LWYSVCKYAQAKITTNLIVLLMKKGILIFLGLLSYFVSFSQVDVNQLFENHPEVIIKFTVQDRSELETLTRIMSIDKVIGDEVTAYTVQTEFEHFLTLNIPFEIVERKILTPEELNMLDFEAIQNSRNDWNYYPNYDAYLSMMTQFAIDYPQLCRIVEFGTSIQNRKLLACVISSNVHEREAEPQVFWSSSMHGDELAGYVLMLRYIDYLLSNYGTDARITHLLDNTEIWINPLANPDGTFFTGNSSVSGARRANANGYDLNRNYPDRVWGDPGGGGTRQKETQAFITFQAQENFVLGANIHGGIELCNYPWDNTYTRHADDAWWQFVCREYADTAKVNSYPGYMSAVACYGCYPGVTNGIDWYIAEGSRQDYSNYNNHNREFTLEISDEKTPPAGQLSSFWNYNYRSFLNYTEQALYGIHGVVTDACTGEPIHAKISIPLHDRDNSFVMTDPRVGFYVRPIKGGTYSLTYSADGYIPLENVSITISDYQKIVKNIALVPVTAPAIPPVPNFIADRTVIEIGGDRTVQFTDLSLNCPNSWLWHFEGGTPETSTEQNPTVQYDNVGTYDVKLTATNAFGTEFILKENYITVTDQPVANFEANKTEIEEGDYVHFTDLSLNATAWEWHFEGGTPETSTEQNPVVSYHNIGAFDVKLTVSNNEGSSDIMIKEGYIMVYRVSVAETDGLSIKLFPNPVLQETSISIVAELEMRKIELVNMLGAVVKTEYPQAISHSFSISGIERGFYLLKVENEKGTSVAKILIM